MRVSPARRSALRALGRIRSREAYAPETLDSVLEAAKLDARDAALATRLVYGALQTQGVLDEVIDRFAKRPGDIEPPVRDVLRLAAYEILFMRTPDHAAVNEAVEAVRSLRPQAAGMANAVLRRVTDEASAFPWGDPHADDEALARATGHPKWMAELLVKDLGRDRAGEVMRAANEPAPLYLWHNPFAGCIEDALEQLRSDGAEPSECDPPGCLRAADPARAVRGEAVGRALVLVTDSAAQLVAVALDPGPGERIADVGAGRGTKTVQVQALAVSRGAPCEIVAVDVHGFKTSVLEERMRRLGVPGVSVAVLDALEEDSIEALGGASFDRVLLDAPCTGLGTLRRHPDKRWRLAPGDVERMAALQARLLNQAAALVRPGGVVVYSTCSLARRENHDVVSAFLRENAGRVFETRSLADVVPRRWAGWVGTEGWFQSLPLEGGPDGHFVAALERTG